MARMVQAIVKLGGRTNTANDPERIGDHGAAIVSAIMRRGPPAIDG